jgi:MFS family permease
MRDWFRATVGGLPGGFWYLWSGIVINRLGGVGIMFLSLYLVQSRGLDSAGAGLVVSLYGVGGCAGVLLGGVLADRWGRRRTLIPSHAVTAAGLAALALVPWVPVIAVLTLVVGVSQSMVGPPLIAAMVDVVPEPDRTRAFSLEFWALNLGAAIAAPLAGMLANVGFTPLFLVEAGATFCTLLTLIFKVPETLPARRRETEQSEGLPAVFADRPFLIFVGLTLVLAVITTQATTILPLSMHGDHLRPSAYGLVTGLSGMFVVAGQLFVPNLVGDRSKPRLLGLATGLLALGTALVTFAHTLPLYLAAATIWTAGQMIAAPANAGTIAELATAPLRARYQAVFYLTFPLAGFVAPAAGGLTLQRLGHWHWMLWGTVAALAAAGHLVSGPARERRATIVRLREKEPAPGTSRA